MAIDTAAKRYSAFDVGSPQRGPAVIPSGTVGPRARSAVAALFAVDATSASSAPTITTASLPNGTDGAAYSQTLAATGDTPISWSVVSGALPAGLTLNASTGQITGTPSGTGTASFTVRATNGAGTDDQALAITVDAAAPSITTVALPYAYVDVPYSYQLQATGTGSITWSVTAGTLPSGLSLSSAGVLSGTASAIASEAVTIQASGPGGTDSEPFTVTVVAAPESSSAAAILFQMQQSRARRRQLQTGRAGRR